MDIAQATVRVVADTSAAKAGLTDLNQSITNLIPGSKVATNVLNRLAGGFYQLIQGISANTFSVITNGMKKAMQASVDTAKALDSAKVSLDNLVGSTEDVDALLKDIQKNAITTPFDIEGLAKGTQQLAMVTKNGAQAERTILNLGKAVAAGGGGTEQLNRLAANLQEIGLNANITTRDIRQFGTASVPILEMVADTVGISTDKVTEYLKSVSNPYDVLVEAINRAGEEGGRFANQYTASAMTMGQVTENLSDSFGIFARNVGESSGVLTHVKEAMMAISERLIDPTLVGTLADSIKKLTENLNLVDIATGAIDRLMKVLGAFNSGQFDNFFVFFQELFNTLKQSPIVNAITTALKVLLDLFSDNHTAEEVRHVAQEIGNLINILIGLKMATVAASYMTTFASGLATAVSAVQGAIQGFESLRGMFQGVGNITAGIRNLWAVIAAHPLITVAAAATTLVVALAALGKLEPVKNFFSSLWKSLQQTVEAFGSFAKSMLAAGHNIIVGLWNGLVQGFNAVIGRVAEMGRAIVNTFKAALGIHSPSTVMRDEVGKPIDQGIAEGIRKNYGTVLDAADEVLEKLVGLQKEWVEEVTDLGALDLVQQLNVYKDFAALYQQGSKARLEMDQRVHDAELAITKQIIQMTEDFNTQFTKAVKNAKEFYNVFEYTQGVITRTTASIIEGMRRQNTNMLQYLRNLQKINSMGYDSDFLQEIMDQGMDAAGEVAGLANATEDEIDEINELWRERGSIATDIAVENTKELRQDTLEQIEYLQSGLDKRIVTVTDSGTLLVDSFTTGIYDGMPKVEDAINELAATASKAAKSAGSGGSGGLGGLSDTFDDIGDIAAAAAGDIDDFAGALDRLNIEAFDTKNIFDLFKNLLSGIPWYVWAGGAAIFGGSILSKVVPAIQNVIDSRKPLVTMTKKVLSDGTEVVEKITKTVKNGVSTTVKSTIDGGYEMINSVSESGRGIDKITSSAADDVGDTIKRTSAQATDSVAKASEKASSSVSKSANLSYRNTLSSTSKIGKAIKKPFQILNTLLDSVISVIENVLVSVGKVLQKGIKVIFNVLNEAVSGIMKLINTVFKGIGKAIKSLLKELSNPKLLIGVGVLAALATTLVILGAALLIFNNVQWESLAKGAVALAGLAVIAGVMGNFAGPILAGSAAIAALGVAIGVFGVALGAALWAITEGLKVAAENLAAIGDIMQNMDAIAIGSFLGILAQVEIALTIITGFAVFGAIGAICAAIIGGGLLIAAIGLAEVANHVNDIDLGAIEQFALIVEKTAEIMGRINPWSAFVGVLNTIASDVISLGLLAAALALKQASITAKEIDVEGLETLQERVEKATEVMGGINAWNAFVGVLNTIASDVIAGGLLIAANLLKEASEKGPEISQEGLTALGDRCNEAVDIMTQINGWQSFTGVLKTVATDVISGGLVLAAGYLKEASEKGAEIKPEGIILLNNTIVTLADYIIPNLNAISLWNAGDAAAKLESAKSIAEKIVPLSWALSDVKDIGNAGEKVAAIIAVLREHLSQVPPVLQSYDSTFQLQGQTWAINLIQGWESQNGNFTVMGNRAQNALWTAIEGKMQDEFYQGQALAGKVLEGIQSKTSDFGPAGAKIQGEFWKAIEGKMQDEYYQGRALANKVLEGIQAIQNSGGYYSAGAQVSEGFANGIANTVGRVNSAVGSLSSAAISKLRELLGIASPSKVFAELGMYVAEGFAEGIEDNLDEVMSTGEALAKAVMEGYNDTIMPLTATVERAKVLSDNAEMRGAVETEGESAGYSKNITINQTNNVYDEMDTTQLVNDLTWAVSRA